MRYTVLLATIPAIALAQSTTTNCYQYTPGSITCNSQTSSPPPVQMPQPANFLDAFLRGQAAAQQAQLAAAQRRNLELQNEVLARQLEEQKRIDEERRRAAESPDAKWQATLQKFAAQAAKRKQQFPDFDMVVGNPDLKITPFMVEMMADRQYAADIAYYLGKHPDEAEAISKMPNREASWAILDIEAKLH